MNDIGVSPVLYWEHLGDEGVRVSIEKYHDRIVIGFTDGGFEGFTISIEQAEAFASRLKELVIKAKEYTEKC